MAEKSTIQINQRLLTLILVGVSCALLGLLGGFWLFGRPALSPSAVPESALSIARTGGEEILQGVTPASLSTTPYTSRFLQQYATEYSAFVRPMSTEGRIAWTGTPVVTWFGRSYIDVALAARTEAGIVMLELRLARQAGENAWAIDQLLSIQLREAE